MCQLLHMNVLSCQDATKNNFCERDINKTYNPYTKKLVISWSNHEKYYQLNRTGKQDLKHRASECRGPLL